MLFIAVKKHIGGGEGNKNENEKEQISVKDFTYVPFLLLKYLNY